MKIKTFGFLAVSFGAPQCSAAASLDELQAQLALINAEREVVGPAKKETAK